MIGYATIGTNDLDRATVFYDAVLEPLGGRRTFANGERMQFYGSSAAPGMIAISKPGTMFGLPAATKEQVDAAHKAALAAGGTCDGPPGQRLPTFYGAYFRDLDGNKICVFNMG
jgi:catechol 2,3-dioxygenase-like lactoylglutathione lyase family enzyme